MINQQNSELFKNKKIDYSQEYRKFKDEMSPEISRYERWAKSLGDIIKLKVTGPGRVRIAKSRELLREKALKQGYDYLLCLDQDIIVPPNIIKKLISHNKDIISGLYFTRGIKNIS